MTIPPLKRCPPRVAMISMRHVVVSVEHDVLVRRVECVLHKPSHPLAVDIGVFRGHLVLGQRAGQLVPAPDLALQLSLAVGGQGIVFGGLVEHALLHLAQRGHIRDIRKGDGQDQYALDAQGVLSTQRRGGTGYAIRK
jgi:hypothetical protein